MERRGVLIDRVVHFRARDVYLPTPQEVLDELYGGKVLEGRVVDSTDSGTEHEAYVVVKVDGMKDFLIVPVERLIGLL